MLPFLKLMRVSVYPSLVSNVLTAWFLAWPLTATPMELLLVLTTSSCFFLGGMVLNDFFDAKMDAVERPERPIPSGTVSKTLAGQLGFFLLIGGLIGVECTVFATGNTEVRIPGWTLAGAVIGYDMLLKRIPVVGALCMGLCRCCNILFVAAACSIVPGSTPTWYALGILCYIFIVTVLSGFESQSAKMRSLVGVMLKMLIPIDAFVCFVFVGPTAAVLILCLYPIALALRKIVPMT